MGNETGWDGSKDSVDPTMTIGNGLPDRSNFDLVVDPVGNETKRPDICRLSEIIRWTISRGCQRLQSVRYGRWIPGQYRCATIGCVLTVDGKPTWNHTEKDTVNAHSENHRAIRNGATATVMTVTSWFKTCASS